MNICEFCSENKKTQKSLIQHRLYCEKNPNRRTHPSKVREGETENLTCPICGKGGFKNGSGLRGHIFRSHSKEGLSHQKQSGKSGSLIVEEKRRNGEISPYKHTKETKEKLSLARISHLGKRKFFSKRCEYNGITLDSSYELLVALSLDEFGIQWERPTKSLQYFDSTGQKRNYLPDFYLPDKNVFLDPKNDWLIKKDREKIRLVNEQNIFTKVIVLNKSQLNWAEIEKLL